MTTTERLDTARLHIQSAKDGLRRFGRIPSYNRNVGEDHLAEVVEKLTAAIDGIHTATEALAADVARIAQD